MDENGGKIKKIQYIPGIFDKFKSEERLDHWYDFPDLMWGLGYEMDAGKSFEKYKERSPLKLKTGYETRDIRRNNLYLLKHASRQIVGNCLFSEWRYYTHWARGFDGFEYDYLCRIIAILEEKYSD